MTQPSESQWHLSKRISVETVVLLLGQAVILTIIFSQMHSQITVMTQAIQDLTEAVRAIPKLDNRISILESNQVTAIAMSERITKLEMQVQNLSGLVSVQSQVINRIDRKLPGDREPTQ
jgi:hypothetical protein